MSNGLRLDANFHPSQTGQQKIHFVVKTGVGAHFLAGRANYFDLTPADLKESPSRGEFIQAEESSRNQVKTFAAQTEFRFLAKRFAAICEKIRPRQFTFHQHRV